MRRKVNKNRINKLIQLLLFTTIIVACYSISKFYSASAGEAKAIIGEPIAVNTLEEIILEELRPGETKTYNFKVANYEESKISDTEMAYIIEIKTEKHLPLQFELKKLENGVSVGENLLKNSVTELVNMGTEQYEQEYELTITWDSSETNYKYSEEIDCVEIIMNSYQVEI